MGSNMYLKAEVVMGIPERPQLRNFQKGSMGLNRGHLRGRDYLVELSPANVKKSQPELFCT